jgi:ornithine cyclodeaminase/alanine dehydrogenase-like protein (mu-crystallin family)
MIYLNKEDILKSITLDEFMDAVEEAYKIYSDKSFNMPDRIQVENDDLTSLYMPCFTEESFGTKILTVAPNNAKINKSVIDGVMLVNDIETGEIVCMMDGKTLTAARTGAVGGVGFRYTTSEDVETIGLIGTGVQGFYQVLYACKARNIKKVYLYNRTKKKAERLKIELEKELKNIDIIVVDSSIELLKNSEVIITATTSYKPVIENDKDLLKGKHIIAIGSYKPDMRELPDALFEVVDKVIVDTEFAKEESGDLYQPIKNNLIKSEDIESMGAFLKNSKGIDLKGKTTLYKSVGMGLFDMVVASKIYKKAIEKGIGQNIDL